MFSRVNFSGAPDCAVLGIDPEILLQVGRKLGQVIDHEVRRTISQ
jgi:hypothetical protein